ncbi:MAG: hypothetical protein M1484_02595 [Patescibacteria group bacterium]|nr:hypothetical protein [Patescibacteria group bacterium]MCL5431970.1 hypothetical protein [Patescibacteria group bacterium]
MLKKFVLLLIAYCPLFILAARPVVAQSENELLPSGQVIDSDFVRAANTIQIDGEIKGDAYLAGGLVTVNGKIDGDLFILGGKVNVNGEVDNSVRIVGGDVNINGPVGRNVALVCGNCVVTKQATIGGSLIAAAGNMELSAPQIGRGLRFLGNQLFLNSAVSNEAYVVAGKRFLLGPNASISGNLKYTGNSQAVLEPGATIGGTISYQKTTQSNDSPRFFGARTLVAAVDKLKPITEFLGFVVMALVGFVLLGLFPRGFEKVARAIENRPTASFGWGILVAIGLPVLTVLFAITIIGIPVALVMLLLGYLIWLAAQYLMAFFVGRKILLSRYGERRGWALVLGLFLIYLLGLIPVLGGLVKLILILFSLGGMVLAYKQPVIVETKPLFPKRDRH